MISFSGGGAGVKNVTRDIIELMREVSISNLKNHRLLACSSRLDFSVRVNSAQCATLREAIFTNISHQRPHLSQHSAFFISRAIKLHGKRWLNESMLEKENVLKNMNCELSRLKCVDDTVKRSLFDACLEMTNLNVNRKDSIFTDIVVDNLEMFDFSQKAEFDLHNGNFESVELLIDIVDTEIQSKGISVLNLSKLPGEELITSQQLGKGFLSRRMLRKLVTSLVSKSNGSFSLTNTNPTLDNAKRFLKIISPLDQILATAVGFAMNGDLESIRALLESESTSVFSSEDPAIKLCFDLCVSLEFGINGYCDLAEQYLTQEYSSLSSGRDPIASVYGDSGQIIADSVVTYCVVNGLDDLSNLIIKLCKVSPWTDSSMHQASFVSNSSNQRQRSPSWNLFTHCFRKDAVKLKREIKPAEPIRFSNKQVIVHLDEN